MGWVIKPLFSSLSFFPDHQSWFFRLPERIPPANCRGKCVVDVFLFLAHWENIYLSREENFWTRMFGLNPPHSCRPFTSFTDGRDHHFYRLPRGGIETRRSSITLSRVRLEGGKGLVRWRFLLICTALQSPPDPFLSSRSLSDCSVCCVGQRQPHVTKTKTPLTSFCSLLAEITTSHFNLVFLC